MSFPFQFSERSTKILPVIFVLIAWWGGVAWLSRDVRPWAIRWTTTLFFLGLLLTYAAFWLVAVLCAANRRRMVFRAITLTLLIPILILIFEATAWFKLVDYRFVWATLLDRWSGPDKMFVEDPELFYRRPASTLWSGRPRSDMARHWNLPVRAPGYQTFTTDSKGFRNQREMDRADVVILGDSYVEGAYVSDEEITAVALEKLLQRPVANLGTAGYGPVQELLVLQRFGFDLRPKMVAWFFFEGNDLYDDHGFESAMSDEGRKTPKNSRHRRNADNPSRVLDWNEFRKASFTVNALELIRVALHPLFPKTVETFGWFRAADGTVHNMYFYDYAALPFQEYERECFERSKNALRQGADLCREGGVRLVVFYIPMKFRVYGKFCRFPRESVCLEWHPWNLPVWFDEFCDDTGIEFIDLTAPMRRAAAGGKILYAPEDSHWNREGHAFVARQIEAAWKKPTVTGSAE